MAYASILFEDDYSGTLKTAPVGFSWTTLFFGFIPALMRGHLVLAALQFVISFAVYWGVGAIYSYVPCILFAFIYNKLYIKYLIDRGYIANSASLSLDIMSQRLGFKIPEANI